MSDQTEYPDSDQPGTEGAAGAAVDLTAATVGDMDALPEGAVPEDVAPDGPDETEASGSGTRQRTTQAQTMSDEERSRFQDHWDEFPGH